MTSSCAYVSSSARGQDDEELTYAQLDVTCSAAEQQ